MRHLLAVTILSRAAAAVAMAPHKVAMARDTKRPHHKQATVRPLLMVIKPLQHSMAVHPAMLPLLPCTAVIITSIIIHIRRATHLSPP